MRSSILPDKGSRPMPPFPHQADVRGQWWEPLMPGGKFITISTATQNCQCRIRHQHQWFTITLHRLIKVSWSVISMICYKVRASQWGWVSDRGVRGINSSTDVFFPGVELRLLCRAVGIPWRAALRLPHTMAAQPEREEYYSHTLGITQRVPNEFILDMFLFPFQSRGEEPGGL